MRNHVINIITKKAEQDERIMVVTADLGYNVLEVFKDNYPNRFFNVGIAEQNMTAMAAGLALEGNLVITYSIGNFPTLRCIEQIRNDVCYHNANVKIISVGGGFAYGDLGMTHHATEDLAMMRSLPNMSVYAPADPYEAEIVIDEALRVDTPCYIRLARGHDVNLHHDIMNNAVSCLIPYRDYSKSQYEVSIVTTGTILSEGIKAEEILNKNGISTRVFSCPSVKPIDNIYLKEIARESKLIVTIEEHSVIGGLGGAVSEVLSEMPRHARLIRFGLQDTFSSVVGDTDYLRKIYGIDYKTVSNRIMELLSE